MFHATASCPNWVNRSHKTVIFKPLTSMSFAFTPKFCSASREPTKIKYAKNAGIPIT